MKYFVVLFALITSIPVLGQDQLTGISAPVILDADYFFDDFSFPSTDQIKLNIPAKTELFAVVSPDGFFHKTYSLNTKGETISTGFMPSPYFMPNNNLILITGKQFMRRDSFNPYGADDLTEWIFLGTVNNFISRLRLGRR